jgi:hypothetical protein
VFLGEQAGARAGASVAAGGSVGGPGSRDEILIGAPGYDVSTNVDAGAVYLIHGVAGLSGPSTGLGLVGGTVSGVKFNGAGAGDELGFAVAFADDVVGTAGDDLLLGAPLADPSGANDAGTVYVVAGESLPAGPVDVSNVGSTVTGTRIVGAQDGERLGSAVASAGDNQADGQPDLLLGAPAADISDVDGGNTLVDAGRVFQTSQRLPTGTLTATSIGDPNPANPEAQPGVEWRGEFPNGLLGLALSGVGDVTENGQTDIVLTAPFSLGVFIAGPGGPQVFSRAGMVYLVQGSTSVATFGGRTSVGSITGSVGLRLTGTQTGASVGRGVGKAGDFDGDGSPDMAVAAPGSVVSGGGLTRGQSLFLLQSLAPACEAPGEVPDLKMDKDPATGTSTATWQIPHPGGAPSTLRYDTVRSGSVTFTMNVACIETAGPDRETVDPTVPPPGQGFAYLVRGLNACEDGVGTLGSDSNGTPHPSVDCP